MPNHITYEGNLRKTIPVLLVCLIFFMPALSFASKSKPVEAAASGKKTNAMSGMKNRVKEIGLRIEKEQAAVKRCSAQELGMMTELNQIDRSLNKARQTLLELKSSTRALNGMIGKTRKELASLSRAISENEAYAKQRLVALYKLSRLGNAGIFASSDSLYDLLKRRGAMERILEADASLMQVQVENRALLLKLTQRLSEERKEKGALTLAQKKQLGVISAKKTQRLKILKTIREKKSVALAAVRSLKLSAEGLEKKISRFEHEQTKAAQKVAGSLLKKTSAETFILAKGRLHMPVSGEIISRFGKTLDKKLKITTFQHGIDIKVKRGDPIRSVWNGQVLYASWFKGYGNMIIINHGESYYTLYAHAKELLKKKGDPVEQGEVIATAGDSASLKGPVLHFEVRYKGKSVNPLNWLKQS